MAAKTKRKEDPAIAARHCLTARPYRMVVYVSTDHNGIHLYCVAGSAMPASKAKNALKEAFKIHGGNCFYCEKEVKGTDLSIDHAEPVAAGGKNDLQNLLIAHKDCNTGKGQMPIECYDPKAGREWLSALLVQVKDRLNRI